MLYKLMWSESKTILVVDEDLIMVIEAPMRDYKRKSMGWKET